MHHKLPDDLLSVGKVLRPHGTRGLLKIWPYAGSEASFSDVDSVYIKTTSGEFYEHKLTSLKPHKKIFLMDLKGLGTKDQAEKFRGAELFVSKKQLPQKEDEYFWDDVLGLETYLDTGEYLGAVSQVIPTGSNDIYVVRQEKKEILIPATYDVVKKIDLKKRTMIITPMEGLLDLNEV